MIRVGVVGASGYGGAETMRLIQAHPQFELAYAASESDAGKEIGAVFPQLRGVVDRSFEAYDARKAIEATEVLFLPVSSGRAMKLAPELIAAGKKVIDFSADFRLRNVREYEETYGIQHACPELLAETAYGIPELFRETIRSARLVANPGCYPTCSGLALAPLLGWKTGRCVVDPKSLIVDAYSGVTGAGRTSLGLDYHFPEVNDSLWAYKVVGHRHTRELEQMAEQWLGESVPITFTPHLAPVSRGILSTVYATLREPIDAAELRELYSRSYEADRFIIVLPEGEQPRSGAVRGTNFVHLSVNVDPRMGRVTILAAEDNLGKGMCGQAVQCMNLMCGLPEETGLLTGGLYP